MRPVSRILFCWPGLLRLWMWGDFVGLGWALVFALLLNSALVTTWIWDEVLPAGGRTLFWLSAIGLWLAAVAVTWWREPQQDKAGTTEDLFRRAQCEYLRGNWYQVELLLGQLFKRHPRDVEAGLIRAAMFRHRRSVEEARQQLRQVGRWDQAGTWQMEIEREWELVERLGTKSVATDEAPEEPGQPGPVATGGPPPDDEPGAVPRAA